MRSITEGSAAEIIRIGIARAIGIGGAAASDIIMSRLQHQCARTTLSFNDDLAARLKTESRRAGRPFRDIVNETLRRGRKAGAPPGQPRAFKVTARALGDLKPGLSLDNVAELIEHVEGSLHR